ncbi:hypothetical protein ACQP1K_26690 [Sphaerimonospora sp. CA-214678]|uniref:hypothetical protein n=1 Tax=Sphaerimonospora sp. CA-214678 TaxID=3240029 RepID=UPI003D8B3B1E
MAVWVGEHGAHLVDYASYHLDPARTVTVVAAALAACVHQNEPGNVTDRARLLAAVRRGCADGPDRREGFRPGPGPGTPDDEAVRCAWSLVDPLGAETLRLLYRHELTPHDLSYVLALPFREVGRLVARTQDIVEILVSGLDGLARGRPLCPDLGPLAAAVFPAHVERSATGSAYPAVEDAGARTALLRHIVTCLVCKRPINIRYTVPQILSHPPIAALSPETRQRLAEADPPAPELAAGTRAPSVHWPPESFGGPLAAPVAVNPAAVAPPRQPSEPRRSPEPRQPSEPRALSGGDGRAETPLYDALLSQIRARAIAARTGDETPVGAEPGGSPEPSHVSIPSEAPALSSFSVPGADPTVGRRLRELGSGVRSARHALPRGREHDDFDLEGGAPVRILEMIARVWALIRATAIRIVIVVVAGAAGTVAGINLLAPAGQTGEATGSLHPSVAGATALSGTAGGTTGASASAASPEATTTDDGTAKPAISESTASVPGASELEVPEADGDGEGDGEGKGGGDGEDAETGILSVGGLRIPSEVELDDFGRGEITLSTTSDKPLKWRITANDLDVKPSSGTLRPGRSDTVSVRAARVRYWCGPPPPVSAPLVLHGSSRSKSAIVTVHWRTC